MHRGKIVVSIALASMTALVVAGKVAKADETSYPGGRWEPPAAEYGELDVNTTVTMPDGAVLSATIGYPADPNTGEQASGSFPVIFQHSPYTNVPNPFFVTRGYMWVNVRPRGTGTSDGPITMGGPLDQNDAKTIIPWAASLPGANGKVGQIGCSFPGFHAWGDAAAIGPNSPLKAAVIQCIGGGKGVHTHEMQINGGILTPQVNSGPIICVLTGPLGVPRQDCIDTFASTAADAYAGGDLAYARQYWNEREGDWTEPIVRNGIPVLMMTNWGDLAFNTALWDYAQFQNASDGRPVYGPMRRHQETTSRYQIIVGPSTWGHGVGLDDGIAMEWFETWLNGTDTGVQDSHVGIHAYQEPTGQWVNASHYPFVANYGTMFLNHGGTLTHTAPWRRHDGADTVAWGEPTEPGTTLVYTTRPFHLGATLAGPISATLYASSSNTNLQVVLTLSDVAPDGTTVPISKYGTLLGSQRALEPEASWTDSRWRMIKPYTVGDHDEYLVPGKTYRFDVAMPSRLWSVEPGHALRLTIATKVPESLCTTAFLGPYACFYTAPQLQTLPGGAYTIARGRRGKSTIQLPLLPYDSFREVRGGPTPSSLGMTEPLDWTTGSQRFGHSRH